LLTLHLSAAEDIGLEVKLRADAAFIVLTEEFNKYRSVKSV
jgi:hypothetical protein